MTYAEMQERIRLQLNEESEAFYDTGDIQSYIKSAIQRFLRKTKCGIVKQSITYTNGTGTYSLTYKPLKARGIVHVPSSDPRDRELPITEVAYEDWVRFTETQRYDSLVCYVDNRAHTISVPNNLENGTLYVEYSIRASDSNVDTIINTEIIPEEYHEAITDYALFLAYKKDRETVLANISLQGYLAIEREARQEVEAMEVQPINDDWSTEITNPHRDEDNLQDLVEI